MLQLYPFKIVAAGIRRTLTYLAFILGIGSWLLMESFTPDTCWPPQVNGLLFSVSGMIIGFMLPNMLQDRHHARA